MFWYVFVAGVVAACAASALALWLGRQADDGDVYLSKRTMEKLAREANEWEQAVLRPKEAGK